MLAGVLTSQSKVGMNNLLASAGFIEKIQNKQESIYLIKCLQFNLCYNFSILAIVIYSIFFIPGGRYGRWYVQHLIYFINF